MFLRDTDDGERHIFASEELQVVSWDCNVRVRGVGLSGFDEEDFFCGEGGGEAGSEETARCTAADDDEVVC